MRCGTRSWNLNNLSLAGTYFWRGRVVVFGVTRSSRDARVNPSATQRRAVTLGKRRSIKREWQGTWLLRAVTCIDLTTLASDDTPRNVQR